MARKLPENLPPAVKLVGTFLTVHCLSLDNFGKEVGLGSGGRNTLNRLLRGHRVPTLEQALAIENYTGIPANKWWTEAEAAVYQEKAMALFSGKGPPKKRRTGRPAAHEKANPSIYVPLSRKSRRRFPQAKTGPA